MRAALHLGLNVLRFESDFRVINNLKNDMWIAAVVYNPMFLSL